MRASASAHHRAELEDPEVLALAARRGSGGRTPGRASRAGSRRRWPRSSGATAIRPSVEPTRSNARLVTRDEPRQAEAADAEHRQAVDVVELHRRADDLEQPRQQRDADADGLDQPDQLERVRRVGADGRDDHALDRRGGGPSRGSRPRRSVGWRSLTRQAGDDPRPDAARRQLAGHRVDRPEVADDEAALASARSGRRGRGRARAARNSAPNMADPEPDDLARLEIGRAQPVVQRARRPARTSRRAAAASAPRRACSCSGRARRGRRARRPC